MSCSKANWCKDLDVIYIDHEHQRHCVFHAPKGKKNETLDSFNDCVFNLIDQTSDKGFCDLSGIVFEGEIDFEKYAKGNPLPRIGFAGAIFNGVTNFANVEFVGEIDFQDANFSEVIFVGTQFKGHSDFSKARFKGKAYFNSAIFGNGASFDNAQFNGEASFANSIFSEGGSFRKAAFNELVRFEGAKFKNDLFFEEVEFKKNAIFWEAIFFKYVYFLNAIFSQTTNFERAFFRGDVDFTNVNFSNINFEDVQFAKKVDFYQTRFAGTTRFGETRFDGAANFRRALFCDVTFFNEVKFNVEVNFREVRFDGRLYFEETIFAGEADFRQAKFNKKTDFERAKFNKKADFREIIFTEVANFKEAKFDGKTNFSIGNHNFLNCYEVIFEKVIINEKIQFEDMSLIKTSFLDTDLRKIDFINCKWLVKNGRKVLFDEFLLFRGSLKNEFLLFINTASHDFMFSRKAFSLEKLLSVKGRIKKVEILYRMLKQKCKDEHNDIEASDWHYGEKEMYRKGNWFRRFFPLSITNLYWLSSGYGEKPTRAGMILLCFVFAISFFMWFIGFTPSQDYLVYGNLETNRLRIGFAYILNTLQYVVFQKNPIFLPNSLTGESVALVARILIPIQTALFVFALRNRFRR